MKQYFAIGQLLIDYRNFYNISQVEFSASLNVDLRTVQRWEKNLTLIKSEKEEDLVLYTLMPYQLIHNLNASIPIPTYYSFKTRKYALSAQNTSLPKLSWYKDQLQIKSKQLRTIDYHQDIKHLKQFIGTQKRDSHYVNNDLIREAVSLLPDLNYVFTGQTGYYAGHCVILPLKQETYKKLRNREITNKELRPSDLTDYRFLEQPIFYRYDICGDCNETIFYIIAHFFRFFMDIENKNYLFCGYTERDDNYDLNLQIGLNVVWEDKQLQKELNLDYPPRFNEGNFTSFLSH